jgi:hypothetical protein
MISMDSEFELSVLITICYEHFYSSVHIAMMGTHLIYAYNLRQL